LLDGAKNVSVRSDAEDVATAEGCDLHELTRSILRVQTIEAGDAEAETSRLLRDEGGDGFFALGAEGDDELAFDVAVQALRSAGRQLGAEGADGARPARLDRLR